MGEVSVVYAILGFVLLVLIIMIPVNVNQTRIYTRNIMRELEAIHQTLRDLAEKRNPPADTREDGPPVQCSWCRAMVPEDQIQRFGDVRLCPACAEKGGRRAIGIGET